MYIGQNGPEVPDRVYDGGHCERTDEVDFP